jgi:uncharacterized protein (DUF111 family)
LEISRVVRSGISATKVDVWVDGERALPREEYWARQSQNAAPAQAHANHGHEHPHDQEHHHEHEHRHGDEHHHDHEASQGAAPTPHGHSHEHSHSHGRGLTEIREIIGKAGISDTAKKTAIAIFEALGTAEAKIHATSVDEVHFHEVGAVDAMVDIVCAAVGAEALGVDQIICSPLNVGGGSVQCAHGTFQSGPATVDCRKTRRCTRPGAGGNNTPTGAAT